MIKSNNPNILELSEPYSWKSHLLTIEKENNRFGQTLFAIYQDKSSW